MAHGNQKSEYKRRGMPEYKSWLHMKSRCFDTNCHNYADYGGRGITVSEEWVNSFEAFYAYVGQRPAPGYSLDRIDVNGNYEPGNVRWATRSIQNKNRRPFKCRPAKLKIEKVVREVIKPHIYKGVSYTTRELSEAFGIPFETLQGRLHKDWPVAKAIETPVRGLYWYGGKWIKLMDVCKNETERSRVQARMQRYGMSLDQALTQDVHANRAPVKHGLIDTPEYQSWLGMKTRCTNPKSTDYESYGGRGIKVCDEWLNSFESFFSHIGPKPLGKVSVDRIDNNGNYEPGNVRWATQSEQSSNQRKRKPFRLNYERRGRIEFEGQIYTLQQLADQFHIEKWIVKKRLYDLKWDLKRALTEPYDPTKRPYLYKEKYYSLAELSVETGINRVVLSKRLCQGMSVEDAVNKPVRKTPVKKPSSSQETSK